LKIKSDTTITANFEIIQYTLKVEIEGNGTTTPLGENLIDCDEEVEIYAIPDECNIFKN